LPKTEKALILGFTFSDAMTYFHYKVSGKISDLIAKLLQTVKLHFFLQNTDYNRTKFWKVKPSVIVLLEQYKTK